jgi:hypothetical protein
VLGRYDYSLAIDDGTLKLGVEKRDGFFVYYRELRGDRKEIILGPETGQIVIHPVEPVAVPKQISLYLEISFDPVLIGPCSKKTLYLTFPVEVGVFLETDSATEALDTFSLNSAKYSLYGTPKNGVITKWHRSRAYADIPSVDRKREGVLKLAINNPLREFADVRRAVFEGHGMVLFFDDELVAMSAKMSIQSSLVAETMFCAGPLRNGMEKGIELLKAKKIPMPGMHKITQLSGVEVNIFLMESGYA